MADILLRKESLDWILSHIQPGGGTPLFNIFEPTSEDITGTIPSGYIITEAAYDKLAAMDSVAKVNKALANPGLTGFVYLYPTVKDIPGLDGGYVYVTVGSESDNFIDFTIMVVAHNTEEDYYYLLLLNQTAATTDYVKGESDGSNWTQMTIGNETYGFAETAAWGSITGSISNQTDLVNYIENAVAGATAGYVTDSTKIDSQLVVAKDASQHHIIFTTNSTAYFTLVDGATQIKYVDLKPGDAVYLTDQDKCDWFIASNTISGSTVTLDFYSIEADSPSLIGYATEAYVESNYVPYSGATKAVDLNGKKLTTGMLHATSFVDFDKAINLGLSSSSAHILFYTGDGSNQHYTTLGPNSTTSNNASVILPSQSGVLALQSDLYNYIPLSGTTSLYGNIIPSVNNAMLGNRSNPFFAIYADGVNTSNVYIGDTNDGANLYWDGEYTTFGIGTAGYFEINNTGKYGRSGIALTTEGQFTYNGNEVATVNQINDATLTIQLNSTDIGTFTANQSVSSTIDITVPTKVTDLTNDAGYLTSASNTIISLATRLSSAEGNIIGLGYSVVSLYSELSNYLPLSGGSMSGSINLGGYSLLLNQFDYLRVDSDSQLIYGNSADPGIGGVVATTNMIPAVYDATLTVQVNSSAVGTFTANASSNSTINIDLTDYTTSSFIAENYVPYSGASKAVNLGTNSFYAENIYGNNIGLLLAGTTFQGFNFYDGDVNLLTGGGPLYINTNSGGAYYDGEEIATQAYVSSALTSYISYVTGTSDISIGGRVIANSLSLASFGITPYENGIDITNTYGNINIENYNGGNINLATSSGGTVRYNGEEIATKLYAGYVAMLAYSSAVATLNKPLNLSLNGYGIGTYYPSVGSTINIDLSTSGYTTVVANPQAPTTSTLTSIAIGGVNYLLPSGSGGSATGDYVPYSGASRYVDLNNQNITNVNTIYAGAFDLSNAHTSGSVYIAYESLSYRMHIQNAEGTIRMEGSRGVSIHARSGNINFWPGEPGGSYKLYYGSSIAINEVATIGTFESYGIKQYSGNLLLENPYGIILAAASSPVNIYSPELKYNDVSVATVNYVQANPSSTTGTLSGIKIGNSTYAIPDASNFVPYSGATQAVDLNGKALTTGMLHATGYTDLEKPINIGTSTASAHLLFFKGDGDNQHYTIVSPNSQVSSNMTVLLPSQSGTIAVIKDIEDYVYDRHTMVNASSLSDTDIDRILVKGGIVILDDEQLALTLAPPNEQLTLTMLNSINNSPTSLTPTITNTGLNLTMANSIEENNDVGLTQTITKTELSI